MLLSLLPLLLRLDDSTAAASRSSARLDALASFLSARLTGVKAVVVGVDVTVLKSTSSSVLKLPKRLPLVVPVMTVLIAAEVFASVCDDSAAGAPLARRSRCCSRARSWYCCSDSSSSKLSTSMSAFRSINLTRGKSMVCGTTRRSPRMSTVSLLAAFCIVGSRVTVKLFLLFAVVVGCSLRRDTRYFLSYYGSKQKQQMYIYKKKRKKRKMCMYTNWDTLNTLYKYNSLFSFCLFSFQYVSYILSFYWKKKQIRSKKLKKKKAAARNGKQVKVQSRI
ncbi:hypothetical protein STCU_10431 [Strigomonas culicis]|uniref:Secreted protein n=1 Tax=Strigomonas culicis TaxID=28005 RepID=S9V4E3_9TRYP|nr:hypothetical protein STCU_10431 [Strigomonas culicis]|eukprot:EPY17740.1 hypothetical protein STCU_10431 [Strigomonas culicis]